MTLLSSQLKYGRSSIGFSDLWTGKYGGLNEDGLAIALSADYALFMSIYATFV